MFTVDFHLQYITTRLYTGYYWTFWSHFQKTMQHKLTPCLLVSSADNLCKQIEPRSGLTKHWALSGSNLFDTQMVFLKEFFENGDFEKKISRQRKNNEKFPRGQRVKCHIVWSATWFMFEPTNTIIAVLAPAGCTVDFSLLPLRNTKGRSTSLRLTLFIRFFRVWGSCFFITNLFNTHTHIRFRVHTGKF